MTEAQEHAARLLFNLWRDVDVEFKTRYRAKIWRMFEDNVRVCATQSSDLTRFVSAFATLMQVDTGRNARLREERVALIQGCDHYDVLQAMRRTSSYVVTLARKMNDQYKQDLEDMDE